MSKRKVFVSFDFENDRCYKYLLQGWDANPSFEFSFNDLSSQEINTNDVGRVKAQLTSRIKQATYTLVIIGKESNKKHKDSAQIGYKNWQNFEIAMSKNNGNKIIAIKIDSTYESPDEIYGCNAKWADRKSVV